MFQYEAYNDPIQRPRYTGLPTFMRAPYREDLEGLEIGLVGVPFDGGVTNRTGARHGPREIRNQSSLMRRRNQASGIGPHDLCSVADVGDAWVQSPFELEKSLDEIRSFYAELHQAGIVPISAGGDHSVTLPILRAIASDQPVGLVHFDAHSDSWSDEPELGHGNMFYHALGEGLIDVAHSVQVGIRTHNDETHGFQVLDADWVQERGAEEVSRKICEVVGDKRAYLTFDIDCLDPAYAPGTGTPVVGGLSTGFARRVLRGLGGIGWVGMDVVEVSPPDDVAEITSLAAATLALDYLCLLALDRPKAGA